MWYQALLPNTNDMQLYGFQYSDQILITIDENIIEIGLRMGPPHYGNITERGQRLDHNRMGQ